MNSPKHLDQTTRIAKLKRISPLWILPILALCFSGWLIYTTISESGEKIKIYFENAQGLIAGRTAIRYQGLKVGVVQDITLSKDLTNIYVDADIYPEATPLLKENTQFWLVEPQASLTGISGLDALVSGNYIAIQPGDGLEKYEFTALADAPPVTPNLDGLNLVLNAKELDSITIGSKIYYKKIPIGNVYNFQLDEENERVKINVFVEKEYAHLITSKSRFWNVSGVATNIGISGVDVQFESLSALIGGAIAVDSPDNGKATKNGKEFRLYPNIKTAGRGIPITLILPDNNNIKSNSSTIMYKGLEIGQVNNLKLSEDKKDIIASATIDPSFIDYLNSGSQFILEEAKIGLTGIENVGNLISGNFLTLVPGKGESIRQFDVIHQSQLETKEHSFSLYADRSFGLTPHVEIRYKGIQIGEVAKVTLVGEKVKFDVVVFDEYKHLIKSNNKFFVSSGVSAGFTDSGLTVDIPPAQTLITGSISFTSEGVANKKESYTLFKNKALAELAQYKEEGSISLTLFSAELPPITKSSPILYRNLTVGKVTDFNLGNNGVNINVSIDKQYAHLINENTVFWNYSGVNVKANLKGVNIQAAPLMAMVRGGIGFDNIKGVENKLDQKWKLYSTLSEAQGFGKMIRFTSKNSTSISEGTPIKYKGVNVGEVNQITPNFNDKNVMIQARIYPEYINKIAVTGSHFWIVKPKISLTKAENLDTLLGSYIRVSPGNGEEKTQFKLTEQPQENSLVTYTLESRTRGSIKSGAPILFREMEVGEVLSIQLSDLSDRVLITIGLSPKYSYLVRDNTVFWNVSGVNMTIGLTGAEVKAGTVDNILRGGIAFSTPDDEPLQPEGNPNSSYLLHKEAKPDWLLWNMAIPAP